MASLFVTDLEVEYIGSGNRDVTADLITPLSFVPIPIQWVIISAKTSNVNPVWVGGPLIAIGSGIPLTATSQPLFLPGINDLSKVYIIGTIGEGVTFTWGGPEPSVLYILDEEGFPILDEEGGYILSEL